MSSNKSTVVEISRMSDLMRDKSLATVYAIGSCGVIDLSHELMHKNGFKALSWWQERLSSVVHAFVTVGIPTTPLMQVDGITPVLQFSDWLPWLDLKAIAQGDIQSMDVFADNVMDWGCGDFAGIYLGSEVASEIAGQEQTARQILARCLPSVSIDIESLLWDLWGHVPYAYTKGTPYSQRRVKSAHHLILRADETTLVAKSVTLV